MKYQRRRLPEPGKALAAKLYGQMKQIERNKTMPVSKAFLAEMEEAEAPEPQAVTYAARWDAETHPLIAGEVLSLEDVETQNGQAKKAVVFDEGPNRLGEVGFFLGASLRNQFEKLNVRPGHIIGIKYLGEMEARSGNTFKNYVVKVQGSTAQKTLSAAKPAKAAPAEDDPFAGE